MSSRDLHLQQQWSEAVNPQEVERAILGSVMEDILQEAIVQTIPEVIVEATQEVREDQQREALQNAQVLVEGSMPGSEEARSLAVSLASSEMPSSLEPAEPSDTPAAEEAPAVAVSQAELHSTSMSATGEEIQGEEGGSIEIAVQVEPIPGGEEAAEEDSEEERLKDRFIQGTIAPKLTTVEQRKLRRQRIYLVVATKVADNLFVTQLMHDSLTLKQQADIRQEEGEILITHNPDDYEAAHMNLDPVWLQEQIRLRNERQENLPLRVFEGVPLALRRMRERLRAETNIAVSTEEELIEEPEIREIEDQEEEYEMEQEASIGEMLEDMGGDSPHIQMPKRQNITEGARRVSATREEEATVAEVEVSTSKRTKATGKNLAAMRRQVAEETGCEQSALGTPRGFKESLYGKEQGSTRVWGGKGRGKGGRKCKGTPTSTSTKKKQKLEEGWQDPAVLRALRGEPPTSIRKALDDACKRKYTGKMIHSTKRGVQKGLQGQPKNPNVKVALKAAAKATMAKKEIKKHGHRDKLRWMKEIKLRQKTENLLIRKLPFQRLVREIVGEFNRELRFQGKAMMALQEAAENFLVRVFDYSNLIAINAKQVTVMPKDIQLLWRIWKENGVFEDKFKRD